MAFSDFPEQRKVVEVLQRSLERGRLGHAYLFTGNDLAELEAVARTLAKTLNCKSSAQRASNGLALDSCDACNSCKRIDGENHPDLTWVRPESKSRVIVIEQIRNLMQTVNLKPAEAEFKLGVIVAADRLNVQAANAFLKTLEEPPPKSILILLSTEPQRLIETILSRCLRLHFAGESARYQTAHLEWFKAFSQLAGAGKGGLLPRYKLLDALLRQLAAQKSGIEEQLSARSPLEKYEDIDARLRNRWEDELAAAIEAEYRRQRGELLLGLQFWMRDVWMRTLGMNGEVTSFPELAESTETIARRISVEDALENLEVFEQTQRLLGTNIQEALALEVGLLKLKL